MHASQAESIHQRVSLPPTEKQESEIFRNLLDGGMAEWRRTLLWRLPKQSQPERTNDLNTNESHCSESWQG
jgi:hypothetical protein